MEPGSPTKTEDVSVAPSVTDQTPAETPVDSPTVDSVAGTDGLGVKIRNQEDIERDVGSKVRAAIRAQDDERDQARIDKLQVALRKLNDQRDALVQKRAGHVNAYQDRKLRDEIEKLDPRIAEAKNDIKVFEDRINQRDQEAEVAADQDEQGTTGRLPNETRQEYLIRTGKITPFAKIGGPRPMQGELADAIIDAEEDAAEKELDNGDGDEPQSHQILRRPGFEEVGESGPPSSDAGASPRRPRKKRKVRRTGVEPDSDDFEPGGDSEDEASSAAPSASDEAATPRRGSKKRKHGTKSTSEKAEVIDIAGIDDGNEAHYQRRLADWISRRSRARRLRRREATGLDEDSGDEEEEWFKLSPDHEDLVIADDLKTPGDIAPSLFSYQKTGIQWLSELYKQSVGGILGDEMGLGKTIQIIAFIATLHYSGKLTRPVIIVAPATVLRQWVNEFHKWWPALRVSVLHSSGSGMVNASYDDDSDLDAETISRGNKTGRRLIKRIEDKGGVLVTTYAGLQIYRDDLVDIEWAYAALDEGHKIRNPNSDITMACKELNTPYRVILTGTPIQNNLTELWCLFDFIYPMRLGTLVNFQQQFESPIKQGGYANASALDIKIAEETAQALKETIAQYLLQRLKVDVAADLPPKTEQVYYCHLTEAQIVLYKQYLNSEECAKILLGKHQAFAGTKYLGAICNHPDLTDQRLQDQLDYDYGSPEKSGKLRVALTKLEEYKKGGHKTLLFSQRRGVLDMFKTRFRRTEEFTFLHMDGQTPITQRQDLIDRFNNDPSIDVFLLTTHVGGLGVNLTGASRIIIYDPDWNPSVDVQARERAWRLGQTKPVEIIRLVTEGTIEDTIYHRQVYKQLLTNKVLKDPKQRASLELSGLKELFTLVLPSDNLNGQVYRSRVLEGAEVDMTALDSTDERIATDVAPVDGVTKVENYAPDNADKEKEKRIVDNIFSRQVANVYDHEAVMSGRKKVQADPKENTREANRLGRIARSHLDRAARDARSVRPGEVTWTGQRGTSGRPGGRRAGPSSAAVMGTLANRRGLAATNSGNTSSRVSTPDATPLLTRQDFQKKIREYMKAQIGGKVPSSMIVNHFNRYCTTNPNQKDVFLSALNSVAVVTRHGSAGKSLWELKDKS